MMDQDEWDALESEFQESDERPGIGVLRSLAALAMITLICIITVVWLAQR